MRELAYKVHTEIGEKFICGIDARTKQKLSAGYQLRHRDAIEIAFRIDIKPIKNRQPRMKILNPIFLDFLKPKVLIQEAIAITRP